MSEELGSLTQSARKKQLRSARLIMFFVGVLSVLVNGFLFVASDSRIDGEIRDLEAQGMVVDQGEVDKIRTENAISTGIGFALGIVFIVLGVLVYSSPVPCCTVALALYILSIIGFGIYNPLSIVQGIIIKIVIIVSLFKSLQAAKAYEAEGASPGLEPL